MRGEPSRPASRQGARTRSTNGATICGGTPPAVHPIPYSIVHRTAASDAPPIAIGTGDAPVGQRLTGEGPQLRELLVEPAAARGDVLTGQRVVVGPAAGGHAEGEPPA